MSLTEQKFKAKKKLNYNFCIMAKHFLTLGVYRHRFTPKYTDRFSLKKIQHLHNNALAQSEQIKNMEKNNN